MANQHVDVDVLCPFYKGTTPKARKIKCEGISSEVCGTHLAFSSCNRYERYIRSYCCGKYWMCRLFVMLNDKYDT